MRGGMRNAMPEQPADVRNKNFKEVALGYTKEMAVDEAQRCLNCKNPKCVEGCPVNVRIPEFIHKVAEGDFKAAYEVITSTNALPALSGRVCPQEKQCESQCIHHKTGSAPVAVGYLERAALVGVGARERSLLMTEELGCCNVARNRSAVECEERTVAALTEVVNAVSHVLLAGARRSEYENGHRRRSHQLYVAV